MLHSDVQRLGFAVRGIAKAYWSKGFHGRQSEMGRTWMVASRTGFHTLEW